MNKNDIFSFISKAIAKTKQSELEWFVITNSDFIKPLPNDVLSSMPTAFSVEHFKAEFSYAAKYKSGYLLLLAYTRLPNITVFNPPDGCLLSLRMQDDENRYAIEVTNSQQNDADTVSLIRLYNLIAKNESSVSTLISDFLRS